MRTPRADYLPVKVVLAMEGRIRTAGNIRIYSSGRGRLCCGADRTLWR